MTCVKVGVAGPVGSGKTALIAALCRKLSPHYSIGVITNDIYTKEDAEFLAKTASFQRNALSVWRLADVPTPPSGKMLP